MTPDAHAWDTWDGISCKIAQGGGGGGEGRGYGKIPKGGDISGDFTQERNISREGGHMHDLLT